MEKMKQQTKIEIQIKKPKPGGPGGGANAAAALVCIINPELCNEAAKQLECVIKNQPPPVPPEQEGNCHWEPDGWRSWRLVCVY